MHTELTLDIQGASVAEQMHCSAEDELLAGWYSTYIQIKKKADRSQQRLAAKLY